MEREPKSPTARGPAATFTGDVWVDPIATRKPEPSRMIVSRVRFAPGARTAWHSHAHGQTLHVVAGVALMQARGGEVIRVHAGETVYTPPSEEHWHGATPDDFMEHLAMLEGAGDGDGTTWLELVSDREYPG
jgi:quercetin dioxygenase-like cupin family protein